jgi:hypothetical protein
LLSSYIPVADEVVHVVRGFVARGGHPLVLGSSVEKTPTALNSNYKNTTIIYMYVYIIIEVQ